MTTKFVLGEEYRNRGVNYKKYASDEKDPDTFLSSIAAPVIDRQNLLSPMAGMKFLGVYSQASNVGEHSVVVLVSDNDGDVYPDEIDVDAGEIHYWGDAKRQEPHQPIDVDSFVGNRNLKPYQDEIENGNRGVVPPILFFEKERKGYVRFRGLCVLEAVTPDRYKQKFDSGTAWTPNYRFHLSILDVPEVDLSWIHNRITEGKDRGAPSEWTAWKNTGEVKTGEKVREQFEGEEGTSGVEYEQVGRGVRISQSFRDRAFDLYNEKCVMTEIRESPLVTLSHIVPRSEAIEYAEDITNVFLLNWTHHWAFDAGHWTIDEELRIRVNPEFTSQDPHLRSTILDREGDKLQLPEEAELSEERIKERNQSLDWMD